ncbi:MAG: hypothetical protein AAF566_12910 [Pseudomonadota bacterium]
MASSINNFEGYRRAAEQSDGEAWAQFLSQFDGFFFLFCIAGLLYIVLAQFARHRRRRHNLDKMRAYWQEQRMLSQPDIGANPRLRFDAGYWGGGRDNG